tara:strand:+ start:297 stop:620 length:324 start_codon:yes stop_codon:yes gene_type:complete
MRNRPIFVKVKDFVDAQGYSIAQIANATNLQIKNLLNLDDDEWKEFSRFVSGIKKLLIADLQEEIDEQWFIDKCTLIKNQITDCPNCKITKDFSNSNNRTVLIELDG